MLYSMKFKNYAYLCTSKKEIQQQFSNGENIKLRRL